MSILSSSCSNKPVEKEMKMPMLFDTKKRLKRKLINLIVKGLIKLGINGCHAACIKITIKKELIAPYFRSTINEFDNYLTTFRAALLLYKKNESG